MFSLSLANRVSGGRFQVCNAPYDTLTLTLDEVKDRGSNASFEQFTLLFRGSADLPMPQGVYKLQEERLGIVEWLLVPVGKEADSYLYEAVFSLLRAPSN